MANKAEDLAKSLDELAKAIESSVGHDQQIREINGWNGPPLNRRDLQKLVADLAKKIRDIDDSQISPKYSPKYDIQKVDHVRNHVANFWNGNGIETYRLLESVLLYLDSRFFSLFFKEKNWEDIEKEGLVPKEFAKKLRSIKAQIGSLTSGSSNLEEQMSSIKDAYEAAQNLPTDLESLQEARDKVDEFKTSSEKNSTLAQSAFENIQTILKDIQEIKEDSVKLLKSTEDAYSAATTKGLAQAFQERADKTASSMWVWVGGLVIALIVGAVSASYRISSLEESLKVNPSSSLSSFNLIVSLFSVGAPIWFAWIATKQIGHRFRLSEDYGFKASVAKAYEGYRREAVRVDPEQAARLFKIAVDRLEEAPLRFVEHETHGSPWHELLAGRLHRRRSAKESVHGSENDNEFNSNEAQQSEA